MKILDTSLQDCRGMNDKGNMLVCTNVYLFVSICFLLCSPALRDLMLKPAGPWMDPLFSPLNPLYSRSGPSGHFQRLADVLVYANPVYGVATICHQVRWLRWGHPSLFHTATSLLIWYKMFCMREISCRHIWMEFINRFSVYAQSGTHSRFNW